jgi:hypothetical protein
MENQFQKFVRTSRGFIVFYLIWLFIHLLLFFNSSSDCEGFWPFGRGDLCQYNYIELFVYLGVPLIIFIIWKLIATDIKKIGDNKSKS